MLLGDCADSIHIARATGEVHRNYGARARRDSGLDSCRVNVQRIRLDIHRDRRATGMNDGVGCRTERHGSGYDFITRLDAGRQHAHVQCRGAGIDARHAALVHAAETRKLFLKLPNLGTGAKPARLEAIDDFIDLRSADIRRSENDKLVGPIDRHRLTRSDR